MPESKNSPRRLQAKERQLQALELRKAGATYDAIARQLGYASRQGAAMAIEAVLKRIVEQPADEVRKLDIERLDMMFLYLMPLIRKGDHNAINAGLRVMERRAKLLGLDMPIRQQVSMEVEDKRDLSEVSSEDLKKAMAMVEGILWPQLTQGD